MTPPQGSKIRIESERGYDKVIAPHGSGGVMRYLIGLFLLAWLGGWAVGWVTAFAALVSGEAKEGSQFLLLWLALWSIAGLVVLWFLLRLFRRSIPEEFLLTLPMLEYDTGVPPPGFPFSPKSQAEFWKKIIRKRRRVTFSPEHLRTLRLRETDGGNRLTLDLGVERFELGASLTEIEREWLFSILAEKYKLT